MSASIFSVAAISAGARSAKPRGNFAREARAVCVAFFLSFMVKISLTGVQSSYGAAAATASAVHAIKGRDPWIAPKTPIFAPLGEAPRPKGRILCHLKNVSYLQDCSTVSAAPLMLRAIRKPKR